LIGPALADFVATHPEVECAMRSGDHERVIALLWDGVVELGLCVWPAREAVAADLTVLLQFREPVVLVAHRRHALARRRGRRISEEELVRLGRPFLRLRWWQSHHPELARLAQRAGTPVEVPMEAARELVLAGPAIAFFTRTYIHDALASGRLVQLELAGAPALTRESALVRRNTGEPLSPAAAALVAAIAERAKRQGLLFRGRRAI
jgi:DNA-binding transcriptional LysR family regulator